MILSEALGQYKMASPVEKEPSIEYPPYGALGTALSARYPVSVTH